MAIGCKPCVYCGKLGHTAFNCPYKPRKRLQSRTPLKAKKRMKRIGKIGKALQDQRQQFLNEHAPPYLCVYCLVIGVDSPLLPEEVNVEHGEAKASHSELRFVKGNLYVSCPGHNQDKGGMSITKYLTKIKERPGSDGYTY